MSRIAVQQWTIYVCPECGVWTEDPPPDFTCPGHEDMPAEVQRIEVVPVSVLDDQREAARRAVQDRIRVIEIAQLKRRAAEQERDELVRAVEPLVRSVAWVFEGQPGFAGPNQPRVPDESAFRSAQAAVKRVRVAAPDTTEKTAA